MAGGTAADGRVCGGDQRDQPAAEGDGGDGGAECGGAAGAAGGGGAGAIGGGGAGGDGGAGAGDGVPADHRGEEGAARAVKVMRWDVKEPSPGQPMKHAFNHPSIHLDHETSGQPLEQTKPRRRRREEVCVRGLWLERE